MKFCPQCKTVYEDKFKFCKKCGVSLEIKTVNKKIVGQVQHREESNDYLVWIIIALIVVAVVGIGFYHINDKIQMLDKKIEIQKKKELDDVKKPLSPQQKFNMKSSVINNYAITDISSSSALVDGSNVYSAQNLIDSNLSTCWADGVSSFGIGEYIVINFDKEYDIHGIEIWNGYQKSSDLFYKNSRPSSICVLTDRWKFDFSLEDRMGMQTFKLFGSTRSVKIVINDVYPGTKYADTCISDISFF